MAPRKKKKDIGDIVGDAAKAVGRAAAQNPLVAQNIKYFNAVKAGPTAVAKTAAIDLAAGAAGAGASKTNPVSEPSRSLDFVKGAHGYATELKDSGSIYVAKVPKASVKNRGSLGSKPSESIVISSAPAKVVAEIPVIPDERILLSRRADVIKAVKRAGAKVPKKK
jgi:hypothetical protein